MNPGLPVIAPTRVPVCCRNLVVEKLHWPGSRRWVCAYAVLKHVANLKGYGELIARKPKLD